MRIVRSVIPAERQVRFEHIDVPDTPAGARALIQIERSIISAGTELSIYTGLEPRTKEKGQWCSYPWKPGYGGIGKVLAVGPDVKDLKPGTRVYGIFPHASHCVIDTERTIAVPVPENLDSTTAAFARMANVALTAYQRSTCTLGDAAGMIALGLVGNLGGQFFVQAGLNLIGIDLSAERREIAAKTGFRSTLDPGSLSNEDLREAVAKLNGKKPPRVMVDAVGESRLVEKAVHCVANNGQVILLGSPRAPYETNCTPMLSEIHHRGIDILGALEWVIPMFKKQTTGFSTEGNAEIILEMLSRDELIVKPLLSHVLNPRDLNRAYQGLLNEKDTYLGVVLDWENNPVPESEPGSAEKS